ncbi:hypothetical protein BDZ85DRAFT_270722 [Elsinoe ampelina]|uniref:Uncharacterized protein n=1 Tax=Elsinoe ampelina TaxID=302913 RepID=A0A6A6FXZ2_9PEZI|nr:hypothetical protein BDZ85DRAFT_270722 [Elsinoe ampelina]
MHLETLNHWCPLQDLRNHRLSLMRHSLYAFDLLDLHEYRGRRLREMAADGL